VEMPLHTLRLSDNYYSLWKLVEEIISSTIPTTQKIFDAEEAFKNSGIGAKLKLKKSSLLMNKTNLLVKINYSISADNSLINDSLEATVGKKDGAYWKIDSIRKYITIEELEKDFQALIAYAESVYR
jgi:hypothetical protein